MFCLLPSGAVAQKAVLCGFVLLCASVVFPIHVDGPCCPESLDLRHDWACRGSNNEEDMSPRSRGTFCPRFAQFLDPLLSKRAREGRAPAGTRDPWAGNAHGLDREAAGATRPSRAMVWTACTCSARWAMRHCHRHLADCRGASKARLNQCLTPKAWRRQTTRHSPPRPLRKYRLSLETCAHLRGCQGNVLQRQLRRCPRPPHPALRFSTARDSPLSSGQGAPL